MPISISPALKKQLEHKLLMGEADHDLGLVFAAKTGGPIKQGCLLDQHFRRILKEAALPAFHSLYTLRHTYCTMQLLARVPVNTVSKQMGHASERFTVSVYGHSIPEMEEAADAITETPFYGKQAVSSRSVSPQSHRGLDRNKLKLTRSIGY